MHQLYYKRIYCRSLPLNSEKLFVAASLRNFSGGWLLNFEELSLYGIVQYVIPFYRKIKLLKYCLNKSKHSELEMAAAEGKS